MVWCFSSFPVPQKAKFHPKAIHLPKEPWSSPSSLHCSEGFLEEGSDPSPQGVFLLPFTHTNELMFKYSTGAAPAQKRSPLSLIPRSTDPQQHSPPALPPRSRSFGQCFFHHYQCSAIDRCLAGYLIIPFYSLQADETQSRGH